MKRKFIAFMMPFLVCSAGFAQSEVQTAPETQDADGLTYWVDSQSNKRLLNKSKFRDNWFIGIQAGGLYSWGTNTSNSSFLNQVRPAFAAQLGKWLAPAGGLRIQGFYNGGSGYASNNGLYHWDAAGLALDGLFNFTNIFCGYKESRTFNLIGLLGAGWEHTGNYSRRDWSKGYYSLTPTDLLAIRLGLIANFRLSEAWDFNVEVTNSWLDDSYDGISGKGSNNRWDGHVNVLLGVSYRFKNHDGSHQFTYATRDMSKYDALNDEINRLREANKRPVVPVTTVETEVIESNRVRTYISFDSGSSKINKLQEVNVFTAAEGMKKFEDSDLYIVANGEVTNADLFMTRAQSIRTVLMNNYSIPAGRIFIEKNAAILSNLDPQQNCVIVYINE